MLENIILGITQGIAEWLPISSEGAIFLIKTNFFFSSGALDIQEMVKQALWLHMGTFLAALIYFRKDVYAILKSLFQYKKSSVEDKKLLQFLIITTLISGLLGLGLLQMFKELEGEVEITGTLATGAIGILLLITGWLQLKAKKDGLRKVEDTNMTDNILLGIVQGLASLPGFSRSGLTVSALLLRKYNDTQALRMSFLMSLPIVLAGNLLMNLDGFTFTQDKLISLAFAFVFGLLTIDLLLRTAKKINFGLFIMGFGAITVVAALMS